MKILIRLPNWLGDVVMSTAFITAVKKVYPDSVIDVIIKTELVGLTSLIPGINTVYPFSKQDNYSLPGAYRFGRKLKAKKYDLFFNLPASLSSAIMTWATGAKKRIGFAKEGSFFLLTNAYPKHPNIHRVDEYITLLEQCTGKIIADKQVKIDTKPTKAKNHKVIINFNSEAESRRMPLAKGTAIINLLTQTFASTVFTFIGSAKEAPYIKQIIDATNKSDRLENLAGKTDLVGLSELIVSSKVMLTTDSGPAHLANSVGIPVIVLFGAGDERITAPYNKKKLTVLRSGKLDCEPCARNTCELYGIPKCMELLNELQIIKALSLYLPYA